MKRSMSVPYLMLNLSVAAALSLVALPDVVWAAEPAPMAPITKAAAESFWWGDFAELERQNALYRQPNRFEPDGTLQLDLFRTGLTQVFGNNVRNVESYLKEVDALTLHWAQEYPKSALAHILHAEALMKHGWSYRGGGYISKVPPEALKEFYAYLRRAVDYLRTHADVALTDSHAHLLLLRAGTALGWNVEQLSAIAREGLQRNPDDITLYFEIVISLLPKWGGDAKVLDDFIRKTTEETRARYGMGMYARLYSYAADGQFGHTLFENSHADWNKMKQGYEDMFARYPNSPTRLNRYAYMACLAKDKPTFLKVYGQVGTKIVLKEWGENPERNVEACRRWGTQL
ncbi:DUF4034 domain-containing protein [uncultured Massilia sp.]|uniref:DUF4034 domain-containing protein n=1 Tax=uncultured Massilia sp. TaxID=169973 RepID=UPI002589D921|nr:DUF4034 domain-containing protein [uncultured Massilia sp.]